ncbi:TonB-dependent receptor [Flavobacteriaceae bacterium F89]|uniref:TonB-dependent receptor n=1 Tax=Cerina litoralis TaxID=2874477 RepID=A0AAE3JQ94_9FLAO|nr:TonB-dependent receptor [Cerina litoralis]MCG2461866.1 TonB-dependent receptor [Cerina litoralis]
MQKHIPITLLALIGMLQITVAQDKDKKDLGTQTVTVVKAYSPTISDAFKIKSVPTLNDSIVLQKKNIEYSINSVPVASTFTPAKGKAAGVEKTPPPTLYNSYASVGVGNYFNAAADFYTSRALNRDERLDVGLNHLSSSSDISDADLSTKFYNTKLSADYTKTDRDLVWGANIGFQHQLYNWYGLPKDVFSQTVIDGIDSKQNYFMGEAGAHMSMDNSFFKGGELRYRRFWDAVKSGENRAYFTPKFEFPVNDEVVALDVKIDYVGGSFKNANLNNTANDAGIDYGRLQFGISPSLQMLRDDLTLNLGVGFVYGLDMENSDGNFYIYPEVTASYRLLDETVIAYGGIEGELDQNSYYGFVEDNPYVSPTLGIQPTDKKYNAYVGLKGRLMPNLSYNVKGSYIAENRKPLYLMNPENQFRNDAKGYYYSNSFQVFYDDIKTLGFFGELNLDVNRDFTLGINAEVFNYNTETDNPAWNLPDLKASLFMDYQIGKQWFTGANLFYVGERKDLMAQAVQNVQPSDFPSEIVTLDAYFDINAHVGYRWTDQWSFFLNFNNIANNNYMRWANFQVQGFQVLGGAAYKFDF